MTIYSLDVLLSRFGASPFFPCLILAVASWPAYRFLRRQVRWSGIPISWRVFHHLLWSSNCQGFGIVNKAEVDVFLELSCFFDDPTMLAIWPLLPLPFLNFYFQSIKWVWSRFKTRNIPERSLESIRYNDVVYWHSYIQRMIFPLDY